MIADEIAKPILDMAKTVEHREALQEQLKTDAQYQEYKATQEGLSKGEIGIPQK